MMKNKISPYFPTTPLKTISFWVELCQTLKESQSSEFPGITLNKVYFYENLIINFYFDKAIGPLSDAVRVDIALGSPEPMMKNYGFLEIYKHGKFSCTNDSWVNHKDIKYLQNKIMIKEKLENI